ncbi:MAG TPA: phosphoribosylaminoimidazolesuccinocarboxamide synthase [Candidatus Accumulibacter phosphatis]|nr:MAG: Phosphoribosylaminoimidazole-succinocarboxamide synthase [Candidatus Accumulibacter sp. SK-11]HAY26081.1 phosphoribosylaminoimidazolesuccinocarboxamide synthase [Accumulibacter sp.]HCN69156.1 phosphoribosylaminoimidazolesuccinocarboxamide synthase [Accumulibacter sp.]HRL74160.1 phosphoribosylaminoimidazolesuccinocarboxamide synthase [Candidatus Accumulibacter phosphatis]HRQ94749.1 phosphoribosylaminoimidazolesuccinocarboxamide synthase [Candidatus Accumulibacter phosphatis]
MSAALFESNITSLPLLGRGKVRDIYAVGSDRLLIVTSDRLSAFDVVLPDPVPDKGRVLTRLACFWFDRLAAIVPNQLTGIDPEAVVAAAERWQVRGRALVVKRLRPLPIEAVVRGYLIGSGWQDYQATGAVCGIALPDGLQLASRLPQPIFTPATKAAIGDHDENVAFERAAAECARALADLLPATGRSGEDIASQARTAAIALYTAAAGHAAAHGIIIADTKFEFGLDASGVLHLIDEALTPDSSRFWPADAYREGLNPPSFDKQYVRDYLETLAWNKQAPGPRLPAAVLAGTRARYIEAYERLTGEKFVD